MGPFYKSFCEEFKLPLDQTLLKTLEEKNEQELKKLDERLVDAEQNLGETEISDALIAIAHYLAKIGANVHLILFQFDQGKSIDCISSCY